MAGRKLTEIRWTIELAASEFGLDRRTLTSRIRQLGLEPGKDRKFSTRDIAAAVFGDYDAERIRKTKEEADKLALANARERGELCEVSRVIAFCQGVGVVLRQKILGSSLMESEKDELLLDLRKKFDAGTVTEQVIAAKD